MLEAPHLSQKLKESSILGKFQDDHCEINVRSELQIALISGTINLWQKLGGHVHPNSSHGRVRPARMCIRECPHQ